jgi:DNA-binding CsgD family transcriptional regulator
MLLPSAHPIADAPADAARTSFILTPREREMLTLLAAGLTAVEIAKQLVISRETVKSHVRSAMLKLGTRTRTHAVVRALTLGEITTANSGIPSESHAIVVAAESHCGRRPTTPQPVRAKR